MIDWQDIRYFSVLASSGSFSAAARTMGVDHATVARRVASLENALSLRLVERLPRSVSLTPEGQAIAALTERMTETVHAIGRHAKAHALSPTAKVLVSAPPALVSCLIAPHIVDFHRRHPAITLVLSGVSRNVALNRGEAQVAIRLTRPDDPDLIVRRIGVMRFALYAARTYAARPAKDWVFIGYDASLDHVAQQAWLRDMLRGRAMVFQANDLFVQQEAARTGLGAVVLPCFMGDPDRNLVRLPVDNGPPSRDVWLASYPDLKRSSPARAVMEFLAAMVATGCPIRVKG